MCRTHRHRRSAALLAAMLAALLAGCAGGQPTAPPTAAPATLPPTWTPPPSATASRTASAPRSTPTPFPTVGPTRQQRPTIAPTLTPTETPSKTPTASLTPTAPPTPTIPFPTYVYTTPQPTPNLLGVNLLVNGGFEGGAHLQEGAAEVQVPDGWTAWWYEGPAAHDDENDVGYARPEMKVIRAERPYLDPPRVFEGSRAVLFFGAFKVIDGGYWQQVPVMRGARLRLTGWAHAWSNNDGDDPHRSQLVTADDRINASVQLGVDPTGGAMALGVDVVWGPAAHIYDRYAQVPPVEVTALGDYVTVFVRGRTLWPFRNNDFYFDAIRLEYVALPLATPPAPETANP